MNIPLFKRTRGFLKVNAEQGRGITDCNLIDPGSGIPARQE